ncbi:hypothetical protein SCHPADRAFT_886033 [Schizopora paradoxa]|uniref:Arrestin-like N-terminal domain-containing protein n=1 Tax=Schizopora paradoxa TaxID=27342 RepID=A0A0H2S355_9AGAM|nr:hypothetical protein SCHPADRAFT_886033 [Schizopora paradoxa]
MSSAGARERGLDRASAPPYSPIDLGEDTVEGRTENPPDYSGPASASRPRRREHHQAIPTPRQTVEHSYSLSKGSRSSPHQPWLTLKLESYAESPVSTPVVLEGKSVKGSVELSLDKPEDITQVIVVFKGRIIAKDVGDKRTFYQREVTLWDRSMGDSNSPTSPSSSTTFKGKLTGQYVWPFAIDLQNRFMSKSRDINDFKLAKEERLPPNLRGHNDLPLIDYQISVNIKRSSIFRLNSSLSSPVTYVPEIPVPRFSDVRERAYGQNVAFLPGPSEDQGGWYKTSFAPVRGLMFKTREIEVDYSLFIALPLTYTRGGVIPLYLVLQSKDKQAVDLLSNARAVRVALGRTLSVPNRFAPEIDSHVGGDAGASRTCRVAWRAIGAENSLLSCSILYGEIALPPNLTPSFSLGQFCMQYYVDVYAPQPTGFEPHTSGRLSRTEITISANSVSGSQPRNLLPPGEVPDIGKENADETFGALADAFHRQSNVSVFGSRGDSLAY